MVKSFRKYTLALSTYGKFIQLMVSGVPSSILPRSLNPLAAENGP